MPPRNEGGSLPRGTASSTAYSVYPTDSIQDVAEALGLPPLRESVASALAADVEYRLRNLVQDASKFMRHGKRNQLRVSDIDRALRQRNIEPIFGFHPTTLGKASSSGAYPTPVGSTFRRIQTQTGPIHLIADEEIDLEKALEAGPSVALGPGVGWSAHWLAIEGVQPAVPQNPTPAIAVPASAPPTSSTSNMVQPGGASTFLPQHHPGKAGQAVAKPLIKHVLSRELQLYFERLTTAILDPPREANTEGNALLQEPNGGKAIQSPKTHEDDTEMADAHHEQRQQFKSSGNTVRDASLASLRGDPGLHQLVPYLIQWIGERIQNGLGDEIVLELMLHTIDALISNPFLGIEPYLHQLLPFVLSILLTASLGQSSLSKKSTALRIQAATILNSIAAHYSDTYPTLKPRIVRTLMGALDAGCAKSVSRATAGDQQNSEESESRALSETPTVSGPVESAATKLGAVIGLRTLGFGPIRALVIQEKGDDCLLKRLGYWCAEVEAIDSRRDESRMIVSELEAAFDDIASSPIYGENVPSHHSPEHNGSIERRVGSFWIRKWEHKDSSTRGLAITISQAEEGEKGEEDGHKDHPHSP